MRVLLSAACIPRRRHRRHRRPGRPGRERRRQTNGSVRRQERLDRRRAAVAHAGGVLTGLRAAKPGCKQAGAQDQNPRATHPISPSSRFTGDSSPLGFSPFARRCAFWLVALVASTAAGWKLERSRATLGWIASSSTASATGKKNWRRNCPCLPRRRGPTALLCRSVSRLDGSNQEGGRRERLAAACKASKSTGLTR